MRPLLLLAALAAPLAVAGCAEPAADDPAVTVDGVDPVQSDGDLAPDATVQPDSTALTPEADTRPRPTLRPEAQSMLDSMRTP